jgi:hypothetical protein
LTFDVGISAYTSASSNINPYDESGASGASSPTHGKPHLELLEVINWPPLSVNYSHNSDNRNNIWNADVFFQTV